jgi:hypothetical protein
VANAGVCEITQDVVLSFKVDGFSCRVRFLDFDHCPVPCIFGVDFFTSAQVRIDFAARRYSFLLRHDKEFEFQYFDFCRHPSRQFPCSEDALRHVTTPCLQVVPDSSAELDKLIRSFPGLFSDELGTVKGMVCHLDLVDSISVRSRPCQCSPPRLRILR